MTEVGDAIECCENCLPTAAANHALRTWIKQLQQAVEDAEKKSNTLRTLLRDMDDERDALVKVIKADVIKELNDMPFYLTYRE